MRIACAATVPAREKVANPIYGYLPVRAVSAGDPLNVIPQFAATATSSHPVTAHAQQSATATQPAGQHVGFERRHHARARHGHPDSSARDCHNSDDNREFGGTGAERSARLDVERTSWSGIRVQPGARAGTVDHQSVSQTPTSASMGPYAMCGKCHDLATVVSNTSWNQHGYHINTGFTCSVCHTAHGMGARSGTISGERLVNFDVNVVAPNGTLPVPILARRIPARWFATRSRTMPMAVFPRRLCANRPS